MHLCILTFPIKMDGLLLLFNICANSCRRQSFFVSSQHDSAAHLLQTLCSLLNPGALCRWGSSCKKTRRNSPFKHLHLVHTCAFVGFSLTQAAAAFSKPEAEPDSSTTICSSSSIDSTGDGNQRTSSSHTWATPFGMTADALGTFDGCRLVWHDEKPGCLAGRGGWNI